MHTICHVITKLELGGAQEVAIYAVSHLDQTRFRPILVAGPGGILTGEAQRLPGVRTEIVASLGRQVQIVADLIAFWQLIFLFRRLRPHIVHTHSSKAGILGRWAAWLARVPIIVHTIHGYGVTPEQSRWVRQCFIWLEWLTGLVTSHWIAVSQADIALGSKWNLFRSGNVSLIRPGIDPTPYQSRISPQERLAIRAQFGVSAQDWLVGSVACFKPQKAPGDFLSVAKQVCNAVPGAKFVLVGDGELRPRLEEQVRAMNLQGRVVLAGWRRDIPKVMQSLDAFLLTSHWEGLPRVLLEARVVGLPTVATDVGGSSEAVLPEMKSWLCRAGDISQLASHLQDVYSQWEATRHTSRGNVEPLPREFCLDEMAKQYESLYDRLNFNLCKIQTVSKRVRDDERSTS